MDDLPITMNPEGPSPDGPGMFGSIELNRDGGLDSERRSQSRPVGRRALRIGMRYGGSWSPQCRAFLMNPVGPDSWRAV